MSNKFTELCWPLQMPPPAKAVLMAIAWHADEFGMAFPGFTTLMTKTCLSKTALLSAIVWLEDNQLVSIQRGGSDAGGTKYSSRYYLNTARLNPELFAAKPRRSPKPVRETDGSGCDESGNRSAESTGQDSKPVRQTNWSGEGEAAYRYAGYTGTGERPVRLTDSTGTSDAPDRSVSRTQPVRETDPKGHERSLKVIETSSAHARDEAAPLPQLNDDEIERELLGIPSLPPGVDRNTLTWFFRHRRVIGKPLSIAAWLSLQPRLQELRDQGHDLNKSLRQTMAAGLALPVTPNSKPDGTNHEQHRESVGNRTRRATAERERRDAEAAALRAVEDSRTLEHEGPRQALGCDG
ncbi:helix-turn-helix domain-containing protein [Stenotrophomonas maltophilia]|uniref:helix-turn-helix domain-containing protein n=1 Tax=Stenotrophomonas maltophilia TaxID=40324 RepID=UPI0015F2453C|nr:helix-turn-helix domain-containing protein [Stenotrophomonas maltophilia]QDY49801.1 helix-turn-helix domain-containing protein [Stenotrophomonas maltophilia]